MDYLINATLLESTKAINKSTGEVVSISPESKLAYSYMYNKGGNGKYTESWERIFTVCCDVAEQKRKKLAKELTKLGLVEVVGTKNSYKIVNDVESVMKDWEFTNEKLLETKPPKEKDKETSKLESIVEQLTSLTNELNAFTKGE